MLDAEREPERSLFPLDDVKPSTPARAEPHEEPRAEPDEEPAAATSIVPRATVRDMVRRRQTALDLFASFYGKLATAAEASTAAHVAFAAIDQRGRQDRYTSHGKEEEAHFLQGLKVPTPDNFTANARKMIDRRVWAVIVELTDLERLMDKKAKDELHGHLNGDDVPEATEENIFATLQTFMMDADTIFKRGIANCFSTLDRRFRSHDGWKIGSRVILSHAFNEWGGWSYNRNQRDTLHDIDRAFNVLDGRENPHVVGGIVAAVENSRSKIKSGFRGFQSEHDSDYFKIRCYMNGNAHVWFKRDDLVEKVNKLLGEYYNAGIPQDRDATDDGGLHTPKTSLAKRYGFFPTPDRAADTVIEALPLYRGRDEGDAPLTVLEPSAGTGNLARRAAKAGALVDCIEYQPQLAADLRKAGIYRSVRTGDFLNVRPDPAKLYDRVVMNPPFDRERDIDHVMHALKFLKPDGCLVAIMSASTEFRETRKSVAFRDLMAKMGARWRDLPAGSFAASGTYCNTVYLRVWNDSRTQNYW